MKSHLLLLLLLTTFCSYSKSFRSLSSREPFEISSVSETEGYKDIHLLAINKSQVYPEIPLKVLFIINRDTLIDYLILNENIRDNIKSLYLYEGDTMQVLISVACADDLSVKIKGNVSIKEPMITSVDRSINTCRLPGSYWDVEQPMMFRVTKRDSILDIMKFQFNFNENYSFDKFYFQVNIISPDSNFRSVEVEVQVNEGEVLKYTRKTISTMEEFKLKVPGKYIVELVPLMGDRRINGINSLGYKLLRK